MDTGEITNIKNGFISLKTLIEQCRTDNMMQDTGYIAICQFVFASLLIKLKSLMSRKYGGENTDSEIPYTGKLDLENHYYGDFVLPEKFQNIDPETIYFDEKTNLVSLVITDHESQYSKLYTPIERD